MIKRILLVDVEFDKTAGDHTQLHSRWTHHPIGLMYLASSVNRVFPEIEFSILHTAVCDVAEESLAEAIGDFRPDLVGFRCLSFYQARFRALAALAREKVPEAVIVAGGPYPTSSYRGVLENGDADICVVGEGEETFIELVARMRDGDRLPLDVAGTCVIGEGRVRINDGRALITDVDAIPFPDYSLVDLEAYQGISNHAFQSSYDCAFIFATRGCPYRCFYCHQFFGKQIRRRSPENVVGEMEAHYLERGTKTFVFLDDLFNVPKEKGKEVLRLIAKRLPDVNINFPNGLRADQLDDEFLDLLEEAGTVHLILAIESATPRLQKLMGKNMKIERAMEFIHKASRRFIVGSFFMAGFPTETMDEVMHTISLAKELDYVAQPVLSIVRVYPGTSLFQSLNPTAEQARMIDSQTMAAAQPRIHNESSFYGDFFPKDKVPLGGDDIKEIRWTWIREVFHNKERIRNSHGVLEKYLDRDQILVFYKNLFDNPAFDEHSLKNMLA